MEHKVKGCSDCPFSRANDMNALYHCKLEGDKDVDVDDLYLPITPEWCPLKAEVVTLSLLSI